jgi:formylglycine-generating enzyme required for sulfatase activity
MSRLSLQIRFAGIYFDNKWEEFMADPKPINECTNPFVQVQGGSFQLGSPKGTGHSDEYPPRDVTMSDFKINQHEVSVGEVRRLNEVAGRLTAVLSGYKGSVPGTLKRQLKIEIPTVDSWGNRINDKGDEYPVQGLTWEEAMLYCQSLDATLPTGAQIEYVSEKGGLTPNAVTYENSGGTPAPVCGPEAEARNNRDGIRDIEGNLWEITSDKYDHKFYSRVRNGKKDPSNPLTKPEEENREARGGSFYSVRGYAQAASRDGDFPGLRYVVVGFRCTR